MVLRNGRPAAIADRAVRHLPQWTDPEESRAKRQHVYGTGATISGVWDYLVRRLSGPEVRIFQIEQLIGKLVGDRRMPQ